MATKIESQNKQIKAWLESGKSLTPLDALALFNSFRLGARVFDLKNDYGMNIKTEMVEANVDILPPLKRVGFLDASV